MIVYNGTKLGQYTVRSCGCDEPTEKVFTAGSRIMCALKVNCIIFVQKSVCPLCCSLINRCHVKKSKMLIVKAVYFGKAASRPLYNVADYCEERLCHGVRRQAVTSGEKALPDSPIGYQTVRPSFV
jgi:hypothetical protein